jgi:hypothetical protein
MAEAKPTPAPKPSEPAGAEEEGHQLHEVQGLVSQYHVPYSEESIHSMLDHNYEMDPKTFKAFEEHLKNTAQGLYPTMASQIKAGIKPVHLFEPYRQVAKQVLQNNEIEPDFVGQSHWGAALTGGTDPESGRPTPMPLHQWQNHIKTTPEFNYAGTPEGKRKMEQATQTLHQVTGGPNNG